LVSAVTPGGPAAKAGVEAGDVILRLDGREVKSVRSLPRLVSGVAVGKTIDVEVMRKGERRVLKAVVGRLEETDKDGGAPASSPGELHLGMKLAPLDDALRQKFGIDAKVAKGIVVIEVAATSAAGRKGIKAGEVIVEAAQEAMAGVEDLVKAIQKVRKEGRRAILLRVEDSKGQMRFVAVPVAE
jgi:serine protease Do